TNPPPPPAVIDLTNEPESPIDVQQLPLLPLHGDGPTVARSRSGRNPRRTNSLRTSPPTLARSDGTLSRTREMPDIIDLTGDSPEIERTSRAHAPPRRPPQLPLARLERSFPDALVGMTFRQTANGLMLPLPALRSSITSLVSAFAPRRHTPPIPAAQRPSPKPPMEPEPPTRAGFTRATFAEPEEGNDEVVVCPCCNEELAYDPTETTVAPSSSAGKGKRKRPPEHHFWALKNCGHVYCAECFENRKPTKALPNGAGFPMKSATDIRCAVDDCETKVIPKGEWVGIYL
ncbi:unnamed protein product, partial [Clonostachys rosea f. rosea IK726]